MANLPSTPTWSPDVYQIETGDAVLGGPEGVINVQAKQLADRTAYLKQQVETAGAAAIDAENKASQALAQIDAIEIASGAASQNASEALQHKQAAEAAKALAELARNQAQDARADAASAAAGSAADRVSAGESAAEAQAGASTALQAASQAVSERNQVVALGEQKKAEITALADASLVELDTVRDDAVAAKDAAIAKAQEATTQAGTATDQASVASGQANIATTQAGLATAARTGAETAQGIAFGFTNIKTSTAIGITDTTPAGNKFFAVIVAGEAIVYENVAGVATERARSVTPATAGNFFGGNLETVGSRLPITTQVTASASYINTYILPSTKLGYSSEIAFHVTLASTPGYASVFFFELVSGETYTVTKEIRVAAVNGWNVLKAGSDFDWSLLPVGSRVGVFMLTGALNISSTTETAPAETRAFLASAVKLGATVTIDANASPRLRRPLLDFTIVHIDSVLASKPSALADLVAGRYVTAPKFTARVRGKKSQNRALFRGTATPANWVIGGWTVSDGLTAPAASNSAIAKFNKLTNANYGVTTAKFLVTDATTSKFGIIFEGNGLCEIDAAASKMRRTNGAFVELDTYGNGSVTIPALISGREYCMTARRLGHDIVLEWLDPIAGITTTLNYKFTANSYGGLHGKPGVLYRAGTTGGIKCTYFEHAALFKDPRIIVFGDSNGNGIAAQASFQSYKPDVWTQTWVYLLDAARGKGDVLNSSLGGLTAGTTIPQLELDLNVFNPDYVVLSLGTNDSVQATWRADMTTIINAVLARGALPVLCTLPPRADRQAFINSANADILGNYFGAYPVIDLAFALTAGNDRLTLNSDYFLADGVHFNVAAHAVAFNRLRADAPFLLND